MLNYELDTFLISKYIISKYNWGVEMTHEKKRSVDATATVDAGIDDPVLSASGAQATGQEEELELLEELAKCQAELQETKNALLRSHADFDNFRKRMRTEREQEFVRGNDRVLGEVLAIVDDFERAIAAVNEQSTVESLQQGVELIYRQLMALLERYKIAPMTVMGETFDPKYHDAVARVNIDDVPEHTIVGEVQRGYYKEKEVFRPARVAVAMPAEE